MILPRLRAVWLLKGILLFLDIGEADLDRCLASEKINIDRTVCLWALMSVTRPSVSFQAPATTTTMSSFSKSTRYFCLGALSTLPLPIPSGLISSGVSGTGLLPGPTNPVTPRVFLTTYQVSSFMIILIRTYPGNIFFWVCFVTPFFVSWTFCIGTRTSRISFSRCRFSIVFSIFAFTLFSYPEYVCTTYQFASDIFTSHPKNQYPASQIDISQLMT